MPKKRIIFTLLFSSGDFYLSRNFTLQKVGDLNWLKKNYDFQKIAIAIDELVILNIKDKRKNFELFCDTIKNISSNIFVPISAGGGVETIEDAKEILRSGADKIVVNSLLERDKDIKNLSKHFGNNCIIGSVDLKKEKNNYIVWKNNGQLNSNIKISDYIKKISKLPLGEIYLNSVDKDGTGQGYDFNLLNYFDENFPFPIIMAGGAGHWKHLLEGLEKIKISAVATANLLNFINNGLINARKKIIENNFDLPKW